jgi:hypothetical protein
MQTIIKVIVAALLIVAATEAAKRVPRVGGLILSLPLTSIIAFVWLYLSEHDGEKVVALSASTFWFVLPSLILFPLLAILMRQGVTGLVALATSCLVTAGAYAFWPAVLSRLGIKI